MVDLAMFAEILQFKSAFVKIIAWWDEIGASLGLSERAIGCVYPENLPMPFAFRRHQRVK
jgi:hypothetical protein